MKALQKFTPEYLKECQKMTLEERMEFLESFRILSSETTTPPKSVLISIKMPEDLLNVFKAKSKLHKIKYQTLIKKLMRSWLEKA